MISPVNNTYSKQSFAGYPTAGSGGQLGHQQNFSDYGQSYYPQQQYQQQQYSQSYQHTRQAPGKEHPKHRNFLKMFGWGLVAVAGIIGACAFVGKVFLGKQLSFIQNTLDMVSGLFSKEDNPAKEKLSKMGGQQTANIAKEAAELLKNDPAFCASMGKIMENSATHALDSPEFQKKLEATASQLGRKALMGLPGLNWFGGK
ncbi:MAG: hypothetical protein AAGI66_07475 [Cyanobacteria bacterium P01_H01_bin.74]